MIAVLVILLTLVLPPEPSIRGIGVPAQVTPPEVFPWPVAWHNWDHDACDGDGDANYWAMMWRPASGKTLPTDCDVHHLLIGNECELERQCDQTPSEVAAYIATLGDRPQMWCCGSLYDWRGLTYTLAVVGHYIAMYGEPPSLLGLHLHVFGYDGEVDEPMLRLWRDIASHFGWHITVSEYACLDRDLSNAAVAECLPVLTKTLERTLRPYAMFWFSYAYAAHAPFYAQTDLVDASGALTPVGVAWWRMIKNQENNLLWKIWMPMVKR